MLPTALPHNSIGNSIFVLPLQPTSVRQDLKPPLPAIPLYQTQSRIPFSDGRRRSKTGNGGLLLRRRRG
ncbi:unnamed protein product [Linum tenue]|uniref:Uncharacterized protein n=1 Tax=Linum tenue TaxID=586396 RepID=A0AAV0KP88_9ROSI|nr:unnamed protein product [Linum tenue]